MTEVNLITTYNGHNIEARPNDNWRFAVTGPEFDESRYAITFSSFVDAKNEIDKRVADTATIAAKNTKFDATVLDELGQSINITRINRQKADIVGLDHSRYCYPNVWWVRDALKELHRLVNAEEAIRAKLYPLRIDRSRGYGRIEADDYGRRIDRLRKELEEKTAQAEALAGKAVSTSDADVA